MPIAFICGGSFAYEDSCSVAGPCFAAGNVSRGHAAPHPTQKPSLAREAEPQLLQMFIE